MRERAALGGRCSTVSSVSRPSLARGSALRLSPPQAFLLDVASSIDLASTSAAVEAASAAPAAEAQSVLQATAASSSEVTSISDSVRAAVDVVAAATPEALRPAVQLVGGDIAALASLSIGAAGVARLGVSWVVHSVSNQDPAREPGGSPLPHVRRRL